ADTAAPEVSFGPAILAVDSGGTGSSTLTAADDVDGELVPDVTCDQGSFADNTYTAPVVSADTMATCTATATDMAGNAGTATLTVSITAPDTVPPVVAFTPATLVVDSGGTGSSTLTATDNVAVTSGPGVTCDQGSFANNTYTAPVVSEDTMATCTAMATDAAGNEGTATVTISIARETAPPVITFSPDTLDVASGATAVLTVTATDNVDGELVPEVTCDQGSFANNMYTAPVVNEDTGVTCTATASDAADNEGTATLTISVARETIAPEVSFSPGTLAVESGRTVPVTVTATDDVDNMVVPVVMCTMGSFANNMYTAPDVSNTTTAACTATATDTAGNESTAATLAIIIAAETTPPVITFSPADITVTSGGTASATVTATDNVGVVTGPDVTCDAGSFADNTYAAPDVSVDTRATCTATATDMAGNEGTATLTISIAREMTPPVVAFSPDTLDVASGATAALTVTATDNVDDMAVPEVVCTLGSFANNTYTAPVVSVDIRVTCTATATDAADNEGTATIAISVAAETEPPVITFSPASLTVDSGGTAMSTLTATDNVDGTVVPTVTCDQGSFANNTYTAPDVSNTTTATCTATASDAAGNAAEPVTLTISVAAETTAPVITFSPAMLTVDSGETGSSTLTATDDVDGTVVPTVVCTDGGSFDVDTGTYTAPVVSAVTTATCTATASDAAGNTGTATLMVSITGDSVPPQLSFSISQGQEVECPLARRAALSGTLCVDSTVKATTTLTATDDVDGTVVPTVVCTDEGMFDVDTKTYTAPVVEVETMATCTATASDMAGNESTATLTILIFPTGASSPATLPGDCPDGFTESPNSPLGGQTLCTGPLGNLTEFGGVLTESATIPYVEDVAYELSGRLDVGQTGPGPCPDDAAPVVLTIEPGVTIVGNSGADVLVVNRCHRLEAAGTPDRPIVFTSKNDIAGAGERESATGEWGGVVILGDAPINRCQVPGAISGTAACENAVEGVTGAEAKYGGGIGDSSSGTLEYVTVRHAGADLGAGLTFGGVGSGTTVNYVQVHNSSGDG
ncbi:MAG: hypothetical protein GDA35_10875, partial [Hyphomonadaceae bacterium]|nr:hypothetical protein [Hyphomonadaceae bacterium]